MKYIDLDNEYRDIDTLEGMCDFRDSDRVDEAQREADKKNKEREIETGIKSYKLDNI